MFAKKEQSCQNNPEKIYTQKRAKHEPSGYSLRLVGSFDPTKKRHNFYRGKDCIERLCKDVKELRIEISNYKEHEMIPLTDEEIKFYKRQKVYHIYFLMIKMRKANLGYTKKSEIIVITPKNLEELIIVFAI